MELTNKTLNLDVKKEYQNEKFVLSGVRQIRLGYLPAGVKIWISTENTGDNLYSLDVKGDGWKDLPEPLYDLYITTKGTSQEKLVLYYSGESSDYYAVGNATTEQVNRVNSIEAFSPNLLTQLYSLAGLNRTDNILYANFWNLSFAEWVSPNNGVARTYLSELIDFSQLNFNLSNNYILEFQGHFDFSSVSSSSNDSSWGGQQMSAHFVMINYDYIANGFTDYTSGQMAKSLYRYAGDKEIESIDNHAVLYGKKWATAGSNNGWTGGSQYYRAWENTGENFNENYIIPASLFKALPKLLFSYKCGAYSLGSNVNNTRFGAHFSIRIVIRELQNIAGQAIITSLPYINNNINLPDLGAV